MRVAEFRFRINATLPSIDGFDGSVIAGVRLGGGDLKVGDQLRVPVREGHADLVVSGFPLIRWDNADRLSIAVTGLPPDSDPVGAIAVRMDAT